MMEKNVRLVDTKHPITNISYDKRGLPIFDSVTVFEARISQDLAFKGTDAAHKAAATRELRAILEKSRDSLSVHFTEKQLAEIAAGKPCITGYTWHHHQDIGRMQLIPRDIHRKTGHVGGSELWTRGIQQ